MFQKDVVMFKACVVHIDKVFPETFQQPNIVYFGRVMIRTM